MVLRHRLLQVNLGLRKGALKMNALKMGTGMAIALLWAGMAIAPATAQELDAEDPAPTPEAPQDESERQVVNCMATATPAYVEWGHRYTYWLSGVAKFDSDGNMLPVSNDHAGDWILTITNSLSPDLETHNVYPITEEQEAPIFSFPAVSSQEWSAFGEERSGEYVSALSYTEATHGLFMGIRNTANADSPRQLFQVVHFISDNYAMVSDVSSCFVGSRPMVIGSDETLESAEQAIAF
ncbi:MAG: hypothetical protein WBA57_10870 [Elainellaceae cyanobacterium]